MVLFSDASFSESLYGLRRRAVKITPSKNPPNMDSGDMVRHSGLERRQKVLSVVFLVWSLLHCIDCKDEIILGPWLQYFRRPAYLKSSLLYVLLRGLILFKVNALFCGLYWEWLKLCRSISKEC